MVQRWLNEDFCWYCWGASECIRDVASVQCGSGSGSGSISMTSRTSHEFKPRPIWTRHRDGGMPRRDASMRDTRSALVSRSDLCARAWGPAGQPQRTTAVQGRAIAGKARAVTGSIAEVVLRCPPFTWARPRPMRTTRGRQSDPVRDSRRCDRDGKARAYCIAVWRLRFGGCGCNRGSSAANPASTKRLEGSLPPSPSFEFGRESVPIDAQQWYCHAPCFENNKVWGHYRLLLGETNWSARPGVDSLRPSPLSWEPDRRTSRA